MKMNKLFLILFFTLILIKEAIPQAAVDIPLSATDGTFTINLAVGLDMIATDCIDSVLGEYNIPVTPPPGTFEIRFDLSPYGCPDLSSYKDYRAPGNPPEFPFTGPIEHTLWFQTSIQGLPINLTYDLPAGTIMSITDPYGGSFLNIGPFSGQGVATIPGTYTAIFNRALLKMDYNNITPVELTSFTASVHQSEKAVQLNWVTATETNNSGFEILRFAQNDNVLKTIGFVPGFGTTTEPKSYSFIDENITTGTYKYRLKQFDFDGSFAYSSEVGVEVDFTPKEFVLYQNYPNPFNPSTTINFAIPKETQIYLSVFNILGEKVRELKNEIIKPGYYNIEFDASTLASGIYIYRIQAGDPSTSSGQSFVQTKKMILLK